MIIPCNKAKQTSIPGVLLGADTSGVAGFIPLSELGFPSQGKEQVCSDLHERRGHEYHTILMRPSAIHELCYFLKDLSVQVKQEAGGIRGALGR